MKNLLLFIVTISVLSLEVTAQEFQYDTAYMKEVFKKTYSPYAGRGYPRMVLWGDSHLHTALSMDAGAFGNRLGMDEAYKFAKGEEVVSSTGQHVRMGRPLDWLVVADHSDGMGFFPAMLAGESWVMEKEEGRRWRKMVEDGEGVKAALEIIGLFSQGKFPYETNDPELARPIWEDVVDAAEKYNEPGKFTAFIGYEWTSLVQGNNLHRNVIFRDDGDKAKTVLPFTLADSYDPEDLWDHLAEYEKNTGGKVLAIPHNGNLSNGMMFAETRQDGQPIDKNYADRRRKWEPVYEVTQIKGDGEAHPYLSPNDEFADYETWDLGNLDASEAKTNEMLSGEYGRSGLKKGIRFQHELGSNPYKFGMIGSTDSHTSLATAEEDNFYGKHSGAEPSKERGAHPFMSTDIGTIAGWDMTSSGYAAVWATENTRKAIWDALARRECYATTGSRMMIRFFGGWDFVASDATTRFPGDIGYQKGVPMGGDLHDAPSGRAPSFLIAALKDPYNGNLDRIQVIKGWVDSSGKTHEHIYDVAVSDDRKIESDGRCKTAVGNTVDLETATWTNSIGDSELITVWTDPDFDPALEAFYYARVIEIPTPRWVLYDKVRLGAEPPAEVELTTQERGYTSPIWYTPN
jgi:Protein of unknown function (DUF3604)